MTPWLWLLFLGAPAVLLTAAAAAYHNRGRFRFKLTGVRLTRYNIAELEPGYVPVMGPGGVVLGYTTPAAYTNLRMEGTGEFPDGRRVNYLDGKTWRLLPSGSWGLGVGGRELTPFDSIAVDPKVIPLDSVCYLPELGRWVKAVDVGDLIKGKHIDLFVGKSVATGADALDWCTVEVYE